MNVAQLSQKLAEDRARARREYFACLDAERVACVAALTLLPTDVAKIVMARADVVVRPEPRVLFPPKE